MLTSEDIKRIKDKEQQDLAKRASELDHSLSIALETNDKYQRENKDLRDKIKEAGRINQLHQELNETLKKRAQEAEGETTIVKGIGMNSPEMKAAQSKIKELADKCSEGGRAMIELNLKYEGLIKEVDRLSEANENLRILLKGTNGSDNSS
tara:strand:- start:1197 stop:1649 length:453 start_codon:yes stop_codon:yes gene_type:complete